MKHCAILLPCRGGRDQEVHLRGYAMATFFPGAGGKCSPASITSAWTAAGILYSTAAERQPLMERARPLPRWSFAAGCRHG